MPKFRALIERIGINPFVFVPQTQLDALFREAQRNSGPIPITVWIAGRSFKQNLVKYLGYWRLYLNTPMRQAAKRDVGERLELKVEFDAEPRIEPMPPALKAALRAAPSALQAFEAMTPSRRKEILRTLNQAKTDVTLQRNVSKVVEFLLGGEPTLKMLGARKSGS